MAMGHMHSFRSVGHDENGVVKFTGWLYSTQPLSGGQETFLDGLRPGEVGFPYRILVPKAVDAPPRPLRSAPELLATTPMRTTDALRLWTPGPGSAKVAVFDAGGRIVSSAQRRTTDRGWIAFRPWDSSEISAGVYFATLSWNGREVARRKLILVR